jgi:hypothetical protein
LLAECFQTKGRRRQILSASLDYAQLTRVSVRYAMREAHRYWRWQRQTPYWSIYLYLKEFTDYTEGGLVTNDVYAGYEKMLERFIHPWFRDMTHAPMGRTMLAWGAVNSTSAWPNAPFVSSDRGLFVNPLTSQLLIEAVCKMPSRLHFLNAENGAVARQAFRSDLSELVLSRGTGKATGETLLRDLIRYNREFLRELFFDGILVREGILDRVKMEEALSGSVSKSQVKVAEIATQIYIERWLRNLTATKNRAAA